MLRNTILIAWRSLKKNRFFSILNILGLAIGMAVFLLIAQYVRFERSYENFIPGRENIYRVKLETFRNNELILASAENYPGVGPAMNDEFPEVVSYARLYNMGYKNNVIITNKDAKPDPIAFKHRRFLYADSAFPPMMGYKMVKGNAASALTEPFTAVVSEKYARMYFGETDPIGKTLWLQDDDFNNELVKVTGVFKNLPLNTHLKFDILFSYKTLLGRYERAKERYGTGWFRKDMYVFIQLRPATDPKKIEARFTGLVNKYKPELVGTTQKDVLSLQPITSIHLESELAEEFETNGSGRIVFFMALIGIFVIAIAWINYINLSTARAIERGKEVGVRKVIGAIKKQLISQFLVEAAMVNLLAVFLAWSLVALALSYFNAISGLSLTVSYLTQSWFLLLISALWIVGTFISGFYPAVVLSSFRPITVLKGKLTNKTSGILLRKCLVVTQFMASIALIAGTLIVYRQLNFMMHQDLGMNIDQVIVLERPGIADTAETAYNSAIDVFRNELKKSPAVENVSTSLTVPGKQREYKVTVKNFASSTKDSIIIRVNSMDYDFMDVFKMKLTAGRNFSPDFPNDDDTSAIITESSIRPLGFKNAADAIGKPLVINQFGDWKPIIVGVVNDYHQVSFKKPLDPSMFLCRIYGGDFYSIRIHTNNLSQTINHVRQSWNKAFPGNPFEYFFLDEYFNRQYLNEQKFGSLFTSFAVLAVIIGCVGLFGLSAYTASQRIKEIGIRKVLGATVSDITMLLSLDFFKLVAIAIVVASPLAWIVMENWLRDFAYRIKIEWWIFALAGLSVLLIAIITVSYQAIKAAITNPVKSLRTE